MSLVLELAGLGCLVVMGFLICPPLGWGIAGAALLFAGQAADGARLPSALARLPRPRLRRRKP